MINLLENKNLSLEEIEKQKLTLAQKSLLTSIYFPIQNPHIRSNKKPCLALKNFVFDEGFVCVDGQNPNNARCFSLNELNTFYDTKYKNFLQHELIKIPSKYNFWTIFKASLAFLLSQHKTGVLIFNPILSDICNIEFRTNYLPTFSTSNLSIFANQMMQEIRLDQVEIFDAKYLPFIELLVSVSNNIVSSNFENIQKQNFEGLFFWFNNQSPGYYYSIKNIFARIQNKKFLFEPILNSITLLPCFKNEELPQVSPFDFKFSVEKFFGSKTLFDMFDSWSQNNQPRKLAQDCFLKEVYYKSMSIEQLRDFGFLLGLVCDNSRTKILVNLINIYLMADLKYNTDKIATPLYKHWYNCVKENSMFITFPKPMSRLELDFHIAFLIYQTI